MMDCKFCCEKCFEKIARQNTRAAKAWIDLCMTQEEFPENMIFLRAEFEEITLLERLGYIITTDALEYIFIKILSDKTNGLYCKTPKECLEDQNLQAMP